MLDWHLTDDIWSSGVWELSHPGIWCLGILWFHWIKVRILWFHWMPRLSILIVTSKVAGRGSTTDRHVDCLCFLYRKSICNSLSDGLLSFCVRYLVSNLYPSSPQFVLFFVATKTFIIKLPHSPLVVLTSQVRQETLNRLFMLSWYNECKMTGWPLPYPVLNM